MLEYFMNVDLGRLGIYPRTLEGSLGIITGPLVHGDFYHLISNTFPIAILGIGVIYFYREISHLIIAIIYVASGIFVWLIARDAYHIGSSGIVYGLMFFMLFSGIIRNDRRQLAISLVILFLYGGSMFSGLMPGDSSISWEAHSMGALAGVACAFFFRKRELPAFRDTLREHAEHNDGEEGVSHTGKEDFYYKIEFRDKEEKDE